MEPTFSKNLTFLTPDKNTYVCVSGGKISYYLLENVRQILKHYDGKFVKIAHN